MVITGTHQSVDKAFEYLNSLITPDYSFTNILKSHGFRINFLSEAKLIFSPENKS
jgi:hypothetical protein